MLALGEMRLACYGFALVGFHSVVKVGDSPYAIFDFRDGGTTPEIRHATDVGGPRPGVVLLCI